MNNNTLYTRCPTCSTAFKVTDEFLELAGGKARCGACLAVFQATDYMLRPSRPSTVSPTKPEKEQTNTKKVSNDHRPPESLQQPSTDQNGTDTQKGAELDLQENGIPVPEPDPLPTAKTKARSEASEKPSTHDSFKEDQHESLVAAELDSFDEDQDILEGFESLENLEIDLADSLDELEHEKSAPSDTHEEAEPLTREQPSDRNNNSDQSVSQEPPINEKQCDTNVEPKESAEQPMAAEDDLSTSIDEVVLAEQEPIIEDPEWGDDDISLDDFDQELDGELGEGHTAEIGKENVELDVLDAKNLVIDDPVVEDLDAEHIEENLDELSVQLFEQMEETDTDPDPLDEFDDIVKNEKEGIKPKLIFALLGIIVFIAIWQFWSNRQSLAWSDNWATTTKAVCNYLPCNLKPQRDVRKIKLLQRQLSPDEDKENYLDIKVLLVNEAKFEQPYPTIKIIFSDKDGQQVSVKFFTPRDYLDTDADSARMPSGSEVHIRFKTEVTHPNALGFEFEFE